MGRQFDLLPLQSIIVPAVLKFFSYPATYLEAQFGRDRHVTRIKQTMDVAAQEKAIARLV